MTFGEPVSFDRIEVSCFGEGTMRIGVQLRSGSIVTGTGLDDLRCGDGPRVVEDVSAVRALDAVSATGSASSAPSA
ncbi:hypothetical protein [Arenivirga flava]|uniref:Uncharacterized protein n=1 Tax=Arenivirga flava TaxID=1930060 RepID=A0AA37UKS6_9MICO|nr:hypothetical protein [Arenivirga flava]GMA29513.1 hypothetical protein GCM10025874_27660 [Arenivirga flava]